MFGIEFLGFRKKFNNFLSLYSPEAAIIPIADDVMYKRMEKEGMGHLAKIYQVMETSFWERANVRHPGGRDRTTGRPTGQRMHLKSDDN